MTVATPTDAMRLLRGFVPDPAAYATVLERAARRRALRVYGNDPVRWCEDHAWGIDYEKVPPKEYKVTLRLWQTRFLAELALSHDSPRRYVVLKSRGVGASWAVIWYATWLLWARGPAQVLLMSDTETKAWDLMRRHRFVTRRLAPELGFPMPALHEADNLSSRILPNGSEIHSLSGDPDNIHTYHPSLIVIDEAAYLRADPRAALVGTQADIIIMSTANGRIGPFAEIWQDAHVMGGETWGYAPLFIGWRERGDLLERPKGDPLVIAQEYPDTPEEAFTASTGRVWTAFSAANVCEEFPIPARPELAWPFIRGLDPGIRGTGWVWVAGVRHVDRLRKMGWPGLPAQMRDGDLVYFCEYEAHDVAIEEQVLAVLARDGRTAKGRQLAPVFTAIDPSDARQQTGRGLRSMGELAGDLGIGAIVKAPNSERAFIAKFQQMFLDRRVWVMENCTILRRQLMEDIWDEKAVRDGDPVRKFSHQFHTLAAAKYALLMEPELLAAGVAERKKGTGASKQTGY